MKASKIWVIYIFLLLVGVLVVTEGLLQVRARLQTHSVDYVLSKVVVDRILKEWKVGITNRIHPFHPPWHVFVNEGFDDQARLNSISDHLLMPRSGEWEVEDFLLPAEVQSKSKYRITTNVHGFRGEEFPVAKKSNTIRVLVLGSYLTFGHGVEDDSTYPAQLQRILAQHNSFAGKSIEVWNLGKQGATAIMGYAFLINNIERLRPDLIIWDYGWVEMFLKRDLTYGENVHRLPGFSWLSVYLLERCQVHPMSRLELCRHVRDWDAKLTYDESLEGWKNANTAIIQLAAKKNLPLMILRHDGIPIPREEFLQFHAPEAKVFFLDTSQAMLDHEFSGEYKRLFFEKSKEWREEGNLTEEKMSDFPIAFLRLNPIHFNELGYEIIAREISKVILKENLL